MSKILIVDDTQFMRKVIKDLLLANHYTDLIEAADGSQAVDMFREHLPELVVLDITMPTMDGLEALKQIKEVNPDAKVLICSAMGQEAMVKEALKHGAKDFVVKPFKPDRILNAIDKLLG